MPVRTFRHRPNSRTWTVGVRARGAPEWKLATPHTDRRDAERLAGLVESLLRASELGQPPELGALERVERLPAAIRDRLVEKGLAPASARVATIREALDALGEWQQSRSVSEAHRRAVRRDIERVASAMSWRTLGDIRAEPAARYLADRAAGGLSAARLNRLRAALKLLSGWAWRTGRLREDVLRGLPARRESTDRRRTRRAFDDAELGALLDAARRGPDRHGLSGPARAALYVSALASGFRASELLALRPLDFVEGSDGALFLLGASDAKNRRAVEQPLGRWALEEIRRYMASRPPLERAWPVRATKTALMIREDLGAARAAWIDAGGVEAERERRSESDFLAYLDAAGRVGDFHSLRVTYCTRLLRAGVPLATVQRLMRHSTPTLTAAVYGRLGVVDLRAGVDAAPLLPAAENRAAGPRAAAG